MAKPASRKPLLQPASRRSPAADKRVYVSQADVPSYALVQALRVPEAINDNYAGKPTSPLRVASALEMQPASSTFRQMCGAAIAYGLTSGGYNSAEIQLTPLANRILRPLRVGEDVGAKRLAFLKPRIIGAFLRKYDRSKFPRDEIARNVLEDMGVPRDRTGKVLEIIKEGAAALGLFEEIKGTQYIHLAAEIAQEPAAPEPRVDEDVSLGGAEAGEEAGSEAEADADVERPTDDGVDRSRIMRRVYITHGKNRTILETLKKCLSITELEPVLSVERETVSIPVPEKVMRDMRSCGAALIHVDDEQQPIGADAAMHNVLNPNVLIEIGAALALYGKRFILIVKEGVKLPSNVQGLYEIRYAGDGLDRDATLRLLEAITALKNEPLPLVWIEDD